MITAKEFRNMKAKKPNKYKNKKVEFQGLKFDSIREYRRFLLLFERARIGSIKELERQVTFELIPKQEGERACSYIADFMYRDEDNNLVVEDSKGVCTPDYVIKRKLMLHVFGIKIKQV